MMDHEEVRAVLEVASVEPGGLDRLEAGDTAEAATVVGHLAGCPTCAAELARLHRAETLLRPLIAAGPAPELKARTLAYIREVGRDRTAGGAAPARAAVDGSLPGPAGGAVPVPIFRRPARRTAGWLAAVAAALVAGVLGGALVGGGVGRPSGTSDPAVALDAISRDASQLLAAGDVRQIVLADASGTARGSLLLSASQGRMLAVAVDLPDPGVGRVYRCWVQGSSGPVTLGTMWRAGGIAWWSGSVTLPVNLPYGVVYGVSLVDVLSSGASAEPVLTGHLVPRGS